LLSPRKVNSQKRRIGKDVPKGIEEKMNNPSNSNPRQDKETPSPNSLPTMLLLLLKQQQPIVRENGTPKSVC
jgi:hypothetical protein